MDSVKMIFLVFSVVVFAGNSAFKVVGKEDFVGELFSREEVVELAGYGEERLSTVLIDGKIFCHDQKISTHPFPVSGASVGVFCGSSRRKNRSHIRGTTDSNGEFVIDLPSHLHAIPNLEKVCIVRVVHLPKSCPCRHGKHKAIKLTSIGEGVRTYTVDDIDLMLKPSSKRHTHKI